jgi:hypothetical protein
LHKDAHAKQSDEKRHLEWVDAIQQLQAERSMAITCSSDSSRDHHAEAIRQMRGQLCLTNSNDSSKPICLTPGTGMPEYVYSAAKALLIDACASPSLVRLIHGYEFPVRSAMVPQANTLHDAHASLLAPSGPIEGYAG